MNNQIDCLHVQHKLRAIRKLHGASRPTMAAVLDVPTASLKNWELGYRSMPLYLATKIVNTFGPAWGLFLLGGDRPPVELTIARVGDEHRKHRNV